MIMLLKGHKWSPDNLQLTVDCYAKIEKQFDEISVNQFDEISNKLKEEPNADPEKITILRFNIHCGLR